MANTPNLDLITTPEVTQKTFKQWRLEMAGEEDSNLTKIDEAFGSISEALDAKTSKIQINYMGNKSFKIKGEGNDLTYKQIRDMLMDSPNFVLMVHGNREHRCTMIDDTSNPRQMRFVAPILSDGVLKTQSIYVTSNDGSVITAVTVSNINSENQSNKVQEITEQIKGSTGQYPSVKAVYDYVDTQVNSIVGSESDNLFKRNISDNLNKGFETDGSLIVNNWRYYDIIPVAGYQKMHIVNTSNQISSTQQIAACFFRTEDESMLGDAFRIPPYSDAMYDVPDGAKDLVVTVHKQYQDAVNIYGVNESIFVKKEQPVIKKGVAFGTSLTYRTQAVRSFGYLDYLPDIIHAEIDNQGVGSAYWCHWTQTESNILRNVLNYTGFADKDFCIIEGCVNDWSGNKTLGNYKDTGTDTVCGCLYNMISHVYGQNPEIQIIVILDHFGRYYTPSSGGDAHDLSSSAVNTLDLTQYDYYEEAAKLCEFYGIPVIKEYALSSMGMFGEQYLNDYIHCNALGAKQSANIIGNEINKIAFKIKSSGLVGATQLSELDI